MKSNFADPEAVTKIGSDLDPPREFKHSVGLYRDVPDSRSL